MELLSPSNFKREKYLQLAHGVILLATLLFCIFWLLVLSLQDREVRLSPRSLPLPSLDYSKIGKGSFAISAKAVSPELEPLVQELVLLGKNTRPDSGILSRIHLGFKSSGAKQELVSGQKLFIAKQGAGFQFSEAATDLSILPLSLTGSDVLLQIETSPDKKEEIILAPSSLFQPAIEEEAYVQSLKKGKMWAPDLFLNQWGGEEYRDLSSKHKVEIDEKIYFLSVGDTLWWDGGEWKIGSSILEDAPLAKLVAVTSKDLKIAVWDSTGYVSSSVVIPLCQGSKASQKAEEVITSVRPRSASEITCQLGKRRVIVKEGDWWVKTDRRWRPLRTAGDLEAFLLHDIQGELFIFEKIESAKGKITLKGRSFDKMRTETEPLSLVVNTEKKPVRKHEPHPASKASMIAKNKIAAPPLQHQNSDGETKP